MKSEVICFEETPLQFANGQRASHPCDGLTLFGPFDSRGVDRPRQITYGVFGTPSGLAAFDAFSQRLRQPILSEGDHDPTLWPHFPGFEEAFQVTWDSIPACQEPIDPAALHEAATLGDAHERVYKTVGLYMEQLAAARRRDDPFQCFICIVPDEVKQNCRIKSKVFGTAGRVPKSKEIKMRRTMDELFANTADAFFQPQQYEFSLNFRRQLKARVMELGVPVQIVLESTLRLGERQSTKERGLTPLSDRAWNLATALYYKAGFKPWKLATARDGVCYVGIAFKDADEKKTNACCAAQMFLDDGDGVVFVGEFGPWYSPVTKQYHLPQDDARRLLKGVLDTYDQQHGKPLREVFLHCRSSLDAEELAGYQAACPEGVKLVAVRVAEERFGMRLYRPGTRPVLRGTFWPVTDRRGFLWASGFKPRLRTYNGPDVPIPLVIDIQHGDADLETVARDIFALTKLNYNACKLGEDQPVTVKFSDAVGEILIANQGARVKHPNFKYYI